MQRKLVNKSVQTDLARPVMKNMSVQTAALLEKPVKAKEESQAIEPVVLSEEVAKPSAKGLEVVSKRKVSKSKKKRRRL